MKCSACEREHETNDSLCPKCKAQVAYDLQDLEGRAEPTESDESYFVSFCVKHGLMNSWADGLGLMAPAERQDMLAKRAYRQFEDNRACGMSQYMAAAKATGVAHRGNQMHARHGLASTTGGFSTSNHKTDVNNWGESVAYEKM